MKNSRPCDKRRFAGTHARSSALVVGAVTACILLAAACSAKDAVPISDETREASELLSRIRSLSEARRALELENQVARERSPYLLVDFLSKTVELKARGMTLRVHALEGYEFVRTSPPGNERWNITEKKPLRELQRIRVAPGNGMDGGAAVDTSWGPARMPPEFDLICEGGRVLEIRAAPGSSSRIIREMQAVSGRFADLARRLRGLSSPADGGRIRLWLGEGDGRTLYWSLPETLPILFRTASGLEADAP